MKHAEDPCKYCDGPGGEKTYANQHCMPINGRVEGIDHCIAQIVAALNAANIRTVASCCGHRRMKGCIALEDGRAIIVLPEAPASGGEWKKAVKF